MHCTIIGNKTAKADYPSPALINSCHFRRCEVNDSGIIILAERTTNNVKHHFMKIYAVRTLEQAGVTKVLNPIQPSLSALLVDSQYNCL